MTGLGIYIPTRSRPHLQTTLSRLPKHYQDRAFLVIDEDQVAMHRGVHSNIIVAPPEANRMGAIRQWLLERSADRNEKMLMLDDDLVFSVRKEPGSVRLTQATRPDIARIFADIEKQLRNFIHVGVSLREGNNHVEDSWRDVGRMCRAIAYDAPMVVGARARFDRTEAKDDFDMTLQLLRAGYPNRVLYWAAQNQSGSHTKGGASDWRTFESMKADSHLLEELHPGLVTAVEKQTKSSWQGKSRWDVRCGWAKAYRQGQESLL